ncbi:MAG: MFS transporter [Chloroflexota bacterium]
MFRLAFAQGFAQVGFHAWIATLPVAMAAAGRPDGEIGAIVGAAAIFNLFAALFSGGLVDRFGGRGIYLIGIGCYLLAAAPIGLGVVNGSSPFLVLLAVRAFQGCGLAAVMPSVMTLLPGQVSRTRLPTAIGVVGIAGNFSLALTPAIALTVMDIAGFAAVGWLVCVVLAAGALLIWPVKDPERAGRAVSSRLLRPAWRPEWARPLLVTVLIIINWGVITGYLPVRAEAAGADVGLFFTCDALALMALRIPSGWLAGRIGPLPLLLTGCLITAGSVALLLLPASTAVLIVAGLGTGGGSALVFPVLNLEINERSDASDRGSAFGLYSVAFASGIAIGSLGIAPFYRFIGFEVAMLGGVIAAVGAGIVALLDPRMRHAPRAALAAAATAGGEAPAAER